VARRSTGGVERQPSSSPEHQAFAGELRSLLESSIDELPDGLREVFMLREVDGLTTAETAECLGVSEDAVKTRLSRSRSALRNLLAERAGIFAPEAFRFPQPRCDRVVAAVFARIS
jgi:RNA polymerase sigma-70 factor, ECF subfamily